MNIKFKKEGLFYTLFFIWGFLISLPLLDAYSGGDQIHYIAYYQAIGEGSIRDAYTLQSQYLGSSELIYPLIAWLGSYFGVDKNVYFSFWNAILVSITGALLIKNHSSALFIALVLTNFYLIVLLTGAERLKFSYIILVLAAIAPGKVRIIILAAAIVAHFQSAINAASILGWKITRKFRSSHTYSQYFGTIVLTICGAASAIFLLLYFKDSILGKFFAYTSISKGAEELYQIALLSIIGALSLRKKARFLSSMLILAIFAFFLGGQRVNMIGVVNLIYFAILEERTKKPLILALMLFFTIKSIPFLVSVYQHGDGFMSMQIAHTFV